MDDFAWDLMGKTMLLVGALMAFAFLGYLIAATNADRACKEGKRIVIGTDIYVCVQKEVR